MEMTGKIAALKKIYEELENKITLFKQKTGLNCVPGCGSCCNHFEPYTSVLETYVVADYLMQDRAKLQQFWDAPRNKTQILCPFYDTEKACHCTIYPIRPMICRLYSFSAKKTRDGSILYSPCPEIKEYYSSQYKLAIELISQGLEIPIYKEEYPKLYDIDFILSTDLHPMTRSVEIALEQMQEILSGVYQQKEARMKLPDVDAVPFGHWVRAHLQNKASKPA